MTPAALSSLTPGIAVTVPAGEPREYVLIPAPEPNRGFREAQEAHFQKPPGGGWEFRIDDEPLQLGSDDRWRWAPRFHAGVVTAELLRADRLVCSYRLDISPSPLKLGRDEFERMFDEVLRHDPQLVLGAEPASARVGALGAITDPWLEFRRIRFHAAELLQAIRFVNERPITSLRHTRRLMDHHSARRVDARTVTRALANGGAPFFRDVVRGCGRVADRQLLETPWSEDHLDGAANRCLTWALKALLRRLGEVRERLQAVVSKDDPSDSSRTPLGPRWGVRRQFLDRYEGALGSALRERPFSEVTRPEVTAAGLNAVAAHPAYGRLYRLVWRSLHSGLSTREEQLDLWTSPTWELYERWCYVRVLPFLDGTPATALEGERARCRHSRSFRLRAGGTATVCLQHEFQSAARAHTGFRSISLTRRPDISVRVEGAGKTPWYAVLDAKYRTSRGNVLDAMASAHIYRDALRWHGRPPDLSLLLVPKGGGAAWLEDPAFIRQERVGVVELCPGDEPGRLLGLLEPAIG